MHIPHARGDEPGRGYLKADGSMVRELIQLRTTWTMIPFSGFWSMILRITWICSCTEAIVKGIMPSPRQAGRRGARLSGRGMRGGYETRCIRSPLTRSVSRRTTLSPLWRGEGRMIFIVGLFKISERGADQDAFSARSAKCREGIGRVIVKRSFPCPSIEKGADEARIARLVAASQPKPGRFQVSPPASHWAVFHEFLLSRAETDHRIGG